ncbi:MAG: N-methyl-L-tryptophan oxidase, partial [Chthoniobacterales bacterium]
YFEDPAYVPLLLRAYELWRELERATGEHLLTITGLLSVGEEGSQIIEGTRRAAAAHGLDIQTLTKREAAARFPTLKIRPNESILFEVDGGVLNPEAAIRAHLQRAKSADAQMRFDVAMESWHATGTGFEIRLADGSQIKSRKLILSLGPWFKEVLGALGVQIRVQRNVQFWFSPATHAYDAPGFVPFLLNRRGLAVPLYGFPDVGDGVKAAFHGWGELTDAQHLDREMNAGPDMEALVRAMEDWMPGSTQTFREAKVCMYSLTPDEHFIVDTHPEHAGLILCGGFSGHGFKFAPVIGEIAADLALDGGTRHDIEFLSLQRFKR